MRSDLCDMFEIGVPSLAFSHYRDAADAVTNPVGPDARRVGRGGEL